MIEQLEKLQMSARSLEMPAMQLAKAQGNTPMPSFHGALVALVGEAQRLLTGNLVVATLQAPELGDVDSSAIVAIAGAIKIEVGAEIDRLTAPKMRGFGVC